MSRKPTSLRMTSFILRSTVALSVWFSYSLVVCPLQAVANPSGKDPNRRLAIHGTIDGAGSLAKSTHATCLEAEKMIMELQEGIQRGDRRPKHKVNAVLDMVGEIWKARRDAEHCAMMGEPAGANMEKRISYTFGPLKSALLTSNSNSPELTKIKRKNIQRLSRSKASLARFVDQAKAAIASGRHMQVQKEMESRGVDLYRDTFLMSSSERNPLIGSFFIVLSACDKKVNEQRRREYGAIAERKAQEDLAAIGDFERDCQRVIGEIRDSKVAMLGKEEPGDAAEALDYIFSQWGSASTAVLRAYALRFAFTRAGGSEARDTLKQLESSAIPLMSRLIDTAAEVSTPEEVAKLHPRMLVSVATASRRLKYKSDFLNACNSSLSRLADKNPDYAEQAKRYERATSTSLGWRKEFSSQRAQYLSTKQKTLGALMTETVPKGKAYRAPIRSNAVAPKKYTADWTSYPAHLLVRQLAMGALGKKVSESPVVRPATTLPICVVPYSNYHYTNILLPGDADEAIADLENALMVDPSHPPLSLKAADALSSARMHDYEYVCGVIKGVRVEGAITRFAKLSNGAYSLMPIGEIPNFSDTRDPLLDRCYRFDMEPIWYQHAYFTVDGTTQ